jgi:hypothetical protein
VTIPFSAWPFLALLWEVGIWLTIDHDSCLLQLGKMDRLLHTGQAQLWWCLSSTSMPDGKRALSFWYLQSSLASQQMHTAPWQPSWPNSMVPQAWCPQAEHLCPNARRASEQTVSPQLFSVLHWTRPALLPLLLSSPPPPFCCACHCHWLKVTPANIQRAK